MRDRAEAHGQPPPAPILATPRLRLAPLRASDALALHALWTTPGVRRFLWDDRVLEPAETAALVARNADLFDRLGFGLWGSRPPGGTGTALTGFTGFWPFRNEERPELVFAVAAEAEGRGLAYESAVAVLRYAFAALGWTDIDSSADRANARSLALLRRLGFEPADADADDPSRPRFVLAADRCPPAP